VLTHADGCDGGGCVDDDGGGGGYDISTFRLFRFI
jgi:hypothetical protein